MTAEHVRRVAEIHAAALRDDFLPSLGLGFLAKGFYPGCIDNPYADVLVAIQDGEVAGFVLVATDPGRYLRWVVRKQLWRVVLAAVRLAFTRPGRLAEALGIVRSRAPRLEQAGEIACIAVDPSRQRRGIGAALVEAGNERLLAAGLRQAYTKTLAGNEHVIRMYEQRWGARLAARLTIRKKPYVYLVWPLGKGHAERE